MQPAAVIIIRERRIDVITGPLTQFCPDPTKRNHTWGCNKEKERKVFGLTSRYFWIIDLGLRYYVFFLKNFFDIEN